MSTTAARVHLRWMIRRDMPEITAIEKASFEFYWEEADFLATLRGRNVIGMTVDHGETVVGYMIYELHKEKIELLNLAVGHGWRRRGIGQQMLAKLISKLGSHRRTRITANIRETNGPAHLLFHSSGFRALRVLRNHFLDSSEDAYQFVYRLGEPT